MKVKYLFFILSVLAILTGKILANEDLSTPANLDEAVHLAPKSPKSYQEKHVLRILKRVNDEIRILKQDCVVLNVSIVYAPMALTVLPMLNGTRVLKAGIMLQGPFNVPENSRKKHEQRIARFIEKYLKKEATPEKIEMVANTIYMAVVKGWFGYWLPLPNGISNIFIPGFSYPSLKSKKLSQHLFVDGEIHPDLSRDIEVSEKVFNVGEHLMKVSQNVSKNTENERYDYNPEY